MTENEAIKQLQVGYLGDTEDLVQAKHIAIKALEENQKFHAIGTIEEFKALKEKQKHCLGYRSENGVRSPQFD